MNDMRERLILEVQNCSEIWDKQNKNHHNRIILNKRWKAIAAELGCTEETCKNTWKYLRHEFGKKFVKIRSGDAVSEEQSWPYFEIMLFLKDQFLPRQTNSNYSNSALSDCEDVEDDASPHGSDEITAESATSHFTHFMLDESYDASLKKRFIPQVSLGRSLLELEREKLNIKKSRPFISQDDEDVGFFNSILPHVKKLDTRKKFIFRMEVQKILFNLTFPDKATDNPI